MPCFPAGAHKLPNQLNKIRMERNASIVVSIIGSTHGQIYYDRILLDNNYKVTNASNKMPYKQ